RSKRDWSSDVCSSDLRTHEFSSGKTKLCGFLPAAHTPEPLCKFRYRVTYNRISSKTGCGTMKQTLTFTLEKLRSTQMIVPLLRRKHFSHNDLLRHWVNKLQLYLISIVCIA